MASEMRAVTTTSAATRARARANESRWGVASTSRPTRGTAARRWASARASVNDTEDIKRRLRTACARASGRASTKEAREDALELVRALESANEGAMVDVSRVSGRWSLLGVLATSAEARVRREKEGAIGAALTDASGSAGRTVDGEEERARSFATPKGNFQDIDLDARTAANRAEFELFGRPLSVTLDAECGFNDVVGHPTRLNVRFRAVEIKFASWPPLRLSLDFASPEGWIETTYVDDDLRTGRGDKGSIFIAARRPDDN